MSFLREASSPIYADLDRLLLSIRKYCHPDAPKEYVVISKKAIPHGKYDSPPLSVLYDISKANVKVSYNMVINGREVELVKDPALDGRLVVVVRRGSRGGLLTFGEVFEILQTLEGVLGIKIEWGRPFPRGSC